MLDHACANILAAIGHTPLVRLNDIGRDVAADIYVKCEYMNPSGSMKDRMTVHMVNQAEARGVLKPGGTIVEATSGNTGAGLAMVGAVRGYHCVFVMPDKMANEKLAALRAFGARVVVCPTAVEPDDPRSYYSVAKRIHAETPNSFYANQHHNLDNPGGHYMSTGLEILEQTDGQVDVFVAGLGTGGTMGGVGRYLKERRPEIRLVGADPVGSLYHDYIKSQRITKPFTYEIAGIGEDFFPSTFDPKMLDEIVPVDDKECFLMARDLVRREGLYAGGSSGAAVAGAVKYARQIGKPQNIVVLLPDGAAKYLSKLFNDQWLRENGFLEDEWGLGTVADTLRAPGDHGYCRHANRERPRRDRQNESPQHRRGDRRPAGPPAIGRTRQVHVQRGAVTMQERLRPQFGQPAVKRCGRHVEHKIVRRWSVRRRLVEPSCRLSTEQFDGQLQAPASDRP